MANKLVIVESPAKARTLSRILGKGYIIKASMGHIRDLPEDKLGIAIDKNFEPEYQNIRERKALLNEIKTLANGASAIYLATDPDREGEAISWHLIKAANLEKDKVPLRRVTFHEITKNAVEQAFENPRQIDMKMVDAQQARRVLDRLVGYKLSPLLWKKVLKGLSAGRVQSVAVRLIVDREREISSFVPVEYWTVVAELAKQDASIAVFRAAFVGLVGEGKLDIPDRKRCEEILGDLKEASYAVLSIQKKEVPRSPAAPFITSTLQQEAWRKLRFTAKRTMVIAQQLYEGLSIGDEGDTGLITYMRTDSTHMATTAVDEIREYIRGNFSPDYLPKAPRVFTKKVKMAQEAHEAVRPTTAIRTPDTVKDYLNREQLQLYELIWKRAVASQMATAIYDTITVDIAATPAEHKPPYLFQTKDSALRFPGFMALYIEGKDDEKDEYEDEKASKMPQLSEKEPLNLVRLIDEQFFTQPPARYSEATLIKALEQKGIGRPSTYAPIISTIVDRGYVNKEGGRLRPEEIGMVVNDLLVSSFPRIVDFDFTAKMENELDEIAKGKLKWPSVVKSFYTPFEKDLLNAQENLEKVIIKSDELCPECGKPMVMKSSKYGKFLACSNYPECKGKKSMSASQAGKSGDAQGRGDVVGEASDVPCPICKKNMVIRRSRYGSFLACPDYPKCTGKQALRRGASTGKANDGSAEPEKTEEKCPKCASPMVVRSGRFGKFLACSSYPKCKATKRIARDDEPEAVAADSKSAGASAEGSGGKGGL